MNGEENVKSYLDAAVDRNSDLLDEILATQKRMLETSDRLLEKLDRRDKSLRLLVDEQPNVKLALLKGGNSNE